MTTLSKKDIENLLPHREPMLLIDELVDIKKLFSATAIVNVKKLCHLFLTSLNLLYHLSFRLK